MMILEKPQKNNFIHKIVSSLRGHWNDYDGNGSTHAFLESRDFVSYSCKLMEMRF